MGVPLADFGVGRWVANNNRLAACGLIEDGMIILIRIRVVRLHIALVTKISQTMRHWRATTCMIKEGHGHAPSPIVGLT